MSLALGIIGLVGSLASTIGGAVGSAVKNKKRDEYIDAGREENKQWWATKKAEDYTQRADAQAIVQKQRELYDEQLKKARAANVVAGGTDESLAMARDSANRGIAETMTNLAAEGARQKDAAEQQYRQTEQSYLQQKAGLEAQQAQSIASAAGQAASAGMQLAGSSFDNYYKKKASASQS